MFTTTIIRTLGKNSKEIEFPITVQQAKKLGYPDIPAYLYGTGKHVGPCEVISDDERLTRIKAEECRQYCLNNSK